MPSRPSPARSLPCRTRRGQHRDRTRAAGSAPACATCSDRSRETSPCVVRMGLAAVAPRPHRLVVRTSAPQPATSSRSVLGRGACDDEFHLVVQIDRACPTGNTYAAGLVDEEPCVVLDTVQQVTGGIEDGDGAVARDVLVRDPTSAVRRHRQTLPRWATDLDSASILRADHGQHLVEGDAPLDLVDARTVAVPGDAQQSGARRVGCAHAAEPFGAFLDDAGCGSKGLDVVDAGGFAEITLLGPGRAVSAGAYPVCPRRTRSEPTLHRRHRNRRPSGYGCRNRILVGRRHRSRVVRRLVVAEAGFPDSA